MIKLAWKLARLRSGKIRKMKVDVATARIELKLEQKLSSDQSEEISQLRSTIADQNRMEDGLRLEMEKLNTELRLKAAELDIQQRQILLLTEQVARDRERVRAETSIFSRIAEGVDKKAGNPTLTVLESMTQ